MNTGLTGKVVLISGTGRGIGKVAAHRFAEEGAHVYGGDLDADATEATAREVTAAGGRMAGSAFDATEPRAAVDWVEAAVAEYGRVDVLYNNAGAVRFGAIADQSFDDWRFTITAELDSVFAVTKAAWAHLTESRGVIVNVGSVVGIAGSVTTGRVAHTASKGGVIALTRQLAAEGAPFGIRANSISPGLIETEGSKESLLRPDHPMAAGHTAVPLRRLGTPDDVVSAALFLASDLSSYITGANLLVDGGWSAVLPSPRAA